MIKRYQTLPAVIEAVQYTGDNFLEIRKFAKDDPTTLVNTAIEAGPNGYDTPPDLSISTTEGEMIATLGDFIIKGVKGKFYTCKPGIFAESYIEMENEHDDEESH